MVLELRVSAAAGQEVLFLTGSRGCWSNTKEVKTLTMD